MREYTTIIDMSKITPKLALRHKQFPVFVERDEDGVYVVECPVLEGCYSQGKTLDEALRNIREVIALAFDLYFYGATL